MSKSRSSKQPPRGVHGHEDRRSVAVTVAWMMSVLATVVAMLASLTALAVVGAVDDADGRDRLVFFPGLLLAMACITSVGCVALIPLVLRFRPDRPPPAILVGAVLIGIAPWATILIMMIPS